MFLLVRPIGHTRLMEVGGSSACQCRRSPLVSRP